MSDQKRADIEQQILLAAQESKKQLRRVAIVTYSLCGVSCTAFLLLPYLIQQEYVPLEDLQWVVALIFASIAAPMLYTLFNRRQSKALAKLTDFDDIRALGPLLNAKNHVTDFKTTDAIYNALKRLLPTIKASDRCLLSDAGYTVLLSSLSGCYSAVSSSPSQLRFEDYYIAVLKAMEQIGDERALGIVEKIASITPKRGAKLRIHSAATECLSALLTRANAEGLGLLRPTEEQSDDNLLRPAMRGIHSLQHNQLLRAGHKDDK